MVTENRSEPPRPTCRLSGTDGNVFAIIAAVRLALWDADLDERAEEFRDRAFNAGSYDDVLRLVTEYVEVE
jgi:hypothetical protein